jgi:hypothetical protein
MCFLGKNRRIPPLDYMPAFSLCDIPVRLAITTSGQGTWNSTVMYSCMMKVYAFSFFR